MAALKASALLWLIVSIQSLTVVRFFAHIEIIVENVGAVKLLLLNPPYMLTVFEMTHLPVFFFPPLFASELF